MENENKKEIRSFFTLTIKAVILNDKNEVLLIKRPENDHHGAGKWDLPGGGLEETERIPDGIKREIEEEVGIKIKIENIICINDFEEKHAEKHNVDSREVSTIGKGIRVLAYHESGEIKLSDEHDEYEWVPLEKAAEKFGDSDFEKDKKLTLEKAREYIEMKEATDRWKRAVADFENYKKRQMENLKETIVYSNANLISEILPVLDNFHISTDHIPEEQKKSLWVVGIMHIRKQLEKIMEDNGVEEIKIKTGDEFNPEIMEAVENKESGKEENKNIVKKIIQKGYKINNKVIRAARVIVE